MWTIVVVSGPHSLVHRVLLEADSNQNRKVGNSLISLVWDHPPFNRPPLLVRRYWAPSGHCGSIPGQPLRVRGTKLLLDTLIDEIAVTLERLALVSQST